MAQPDPKNRFLTLENVRVSYRAKTDSIHLVALDPDLPEGLHIGLQRGTSSEAHLRELLEEFNVAPKTVLEETETLTSVLPKVAPLSLRTYLDPRQAAQTYFPLGLLATGDPRADFIMTSPHTSMPVSVAGWDPRGGQVSFGETNKDRCPKAPHLLIVGAPGQGKSVLASNIATMALVRNDWWEVKSTSNEFLDEGLGEHKAFTASALGFLSLLKETMMQVRERLAVLRSTSDFQWDPKKHGGPLQLLMLDDVSHLLRESDSSSEEALELLKEIARVGGAVGVHIVLTVQGGTPSFFRDELFSHFGARAIVGSVSAGVSAAVLGEDHADGSKMPVGRVRFGEYGGAPKILQGFFAVP